MDQPTKKWHLPGHWQLLWLLGFIAALLLSAFFLTWVGISIQSAKWELLGVTLPAFLASAGSLYWLATRIKTVLVSDHSVILEAAAFEREIEFEEIERVGLMPHRRGWIVLILHKGGGGTSLKARTRDWADLIAARGAVPLDVEGAAESAAS